MNWDDIKKLWTKANTPMWTPSQQLQDANTKQVDESAPFQQEPSLDPNMVLKQVSNFLTPVNVASTALTAGGAGAARAGLGAVAKGAEVADTALKAPNVLTGVADMATGHPVAGAMGVVSGAHGLVPNLSKAQFATALRKDPSIADKLAAAGDMPMGKAARDIAERRTTPFGRPPIGVSDRRQAELASGMRSNVPAIPITDTRYKELLNKFGMTPPPPNVVDSGANWENIARNVSYGEGGIMPSGVRPSEFPAMDEMWNLAKGKSKRPR